MPPPPLRLKQVELYSWRKEMCENGSGHCPSLHMWVSKLHAAVKQTRVEVQWACGTQANEWTRRRLKGVLPEHGGAKPAPSPTPPSGWIQRVISVDRQAKSLVEKGQSYWSVTLPLMGGRWMSHWPESHRNTRGPKVSEPPPRHWFMHYWCSIEQQRINVRSLLVSKL